jgi:hypothetical protein
MLNYQDAEKSSYCQSATTHAVIAVLFVEITPEDVVTFNDQITVRADSTAPEVSEGTGVIMQIKALPKGRNKTMSFRTAKESEAVTVCSLEPGDGSDKPPC